MKKKERHLKIVENNTSGEPTGSPFSYVKKYAWVLMPIAVIIGLALMLKKGAGGERPVIDIDA